jgi:UDP-3-O-[3-hydroxymyristoyl] glucosamine N-acyltransferase
MADPRFHTVAGPFTLRRLAEIAGAEIVGDADPETVIADVAPLETATARELSFLDNRLYVEAFARSQAGACLVRREMVGKAPPGMALLVTPEPYQGYARVAQAFYPRPQMAAAIAPSATIDPTARLGTGCRVEPGAVVGPRSEIGARCRIGANAVIGEAVVVGDDCEIGPCASLTHCVIGARVVIHAGARIGQDGFGFALGARGHTKVPQLGRVVVGNDVEIGANTTIDRGTGPDTVIGDGTKIDNLVQIGHNVQLGRNCVIVAQVGISGSTRVGDFVMMGGQVGLAGHLTIGSGARIAAKSGVMRDIEPGTVYSGFPAVPAKEHWRQVAILAKMAKGKKGE